jgi:hypothetical protein
MKALIALNQIVSNITSWELNPNWDGVNPRKKYLPVSSEIQNSARVAEVEPNNAIFPIGEPLFWVDCADDVVADIFYFDTETQTINLIINAPYPE